MSDVGGAGRTTTAMSARCDFVARDQRPDRTRLSRSGTGDFAIRPRRPRCLRDLRPRLPIAGAGNRVRCRGAEPDAVAARYHRRYDIDVRFRIDTECGENDLDRSESKVAAALAQCGPNPALGTATTGIPYPVPPNEMPQQQPGGRRRPSGIVRARRKWPSPVRTGPLRKSGSAGGRRYPIRGCRGRAFSHSGEAVPSGVDQRGEP